MEHQTELGRGWIGAYIVPNKSPDVVTTTAGNVPDNLTNVQVDSNKFNYLFGRAADDSHNTPRTKQLALHMERLGIIDDAKGRGILEDHFKDVARQDGNIVKNWTDEYGTFEVRESVFIGPSGKAVKFETGFEVYEDGTRRFITAIPKADWKKYGSGGADNLKSAGVPPDWWPYNVVNEK